MCWPDSAPNPSHLLTIIPFVLSFSTKGRSLTRGHFRQGYQTNQSKGYWLAPRSSMHHTRFSSKASSASRLSHPVRVHFRDSTNFPQSDFSQLLKPNQRYNRSQKRSK
ncbi:hypothetical protein FA15DRAFT_438265 [Coprinopsis marcescibilis]|uniref:Uncharacterized protein n=1 Tax=Coprinopsis marcescibilis TaxID=230819 RepID=A0A5C3KUC3_COPMA|nr:hypothetical protein FA15DRAFT_438265 [Coprinopsis marcescibilis]